MRRIIAMLLVILFTISIPQAPACMAKARYIQESSAVIIDDMGYIDDLSKQFIVDAALFMVARYIR